MSVEHMWPHLGKQQLRQQRRRSSLQNAANGCENALTEKHLHESEKKKYSSRMDVRCSISIEKTQVHLVGL